LGPEFSAAQIKEFIAANGIVATELTGDEIPSRIAALIAEEKVIGWFQGRMEFGPRALGSRSIIGDARSPRMQEVMNLKIKFRESFRPFAPTVLAERASAYFDIDRESPYMLLTASVLPGVRRPVREEDRSLAGIEKLKIVRSEIPAVTHVDYSARLQTVSARDNALYHRLLAKFDEMYGCPVVINTSFNVRGEPIVCSPQDAYACFMRTDMDYLILGSFLLDKRDQKPLAEKVDWRKQFELD